MTVQFGFMDNRCFCLKISKTSSNMMALFENANQHVKKSRNTGRRRSVPPKPWLNQVPTMANVALEFRWQMLHLLQCQWSFAMCRRGLCHRGCNLPFQGFVHPFFERMLAARGLYAASVASDMLLGILIPKINKAPPRALKTRF